MNLIYRSLYFLISICLLANTLPSTLEHIIGEDHEHHSHVCDSKFCYQEKAVECESIDLAENKKYSLSTNINYSIFLQEAPHQAYKTILLTFTLSKDIRQRGPPVLV